MKLQSRFLLLLFCFSWITFFAQTSESHPKLVVGIVVDQMRWDYLYRYQDRYQDNGFKRLLSEGFSAENMHINYIPTYTAIGHSSIYTGSVPSIHGIAGNNFIVQKTGDKIYCTQDDDVEGVGVKGKTGRHSPKNLLTSTITDQLKLATNFKSKVIGISLKDRGAILPGGHFADASYWLDDETGNWVSSTFYMETMPNWVQKFNNQKIPEKYFKKGWNTLYPIDSYVLSTEDNTLYEKPFKGEDNPVFPRDLENIFKHHKSKYGLIKAIPQGNSFTLEFAKEAIEKESLGNNSQNVPDFLAVSLSATDYVGHQFGINSIEIEDTYLRLDADLADFMDYLDKKIGKGNYTLFLSADHGASHNPKYFMDKGGPGGYFDIGIIRKNLNSKLKEVFNEDEIVYSLWNYQVHLNNPLIEEKSLNEEAIRKVIMRELKKERGVAYVVEMEKVSTSSIPAKIKERIINGYHHKRSGIIQIILEPQWYSGKADGKGTTHGSWHSYDAHIPAVFMGWGITSGKTNRETYMTDIAPTLSQILKIEFPNGNIGEPIIEAIRK